MERLIQGFSRVARKIDDVDQLIEAFPALEKTAISDPSSLSDNDKRRVLDFPEADTQAANIAQATSLSKLELLKRAASSPADLTTSELNLLKLRYWPDRTKEERQALRAAFAAFDGEDDFARASERLKKVRSVLFDEYEEKALANAEAEATRRLIEAASGGPGAQQQRREKSERAIAHARPWVRRLWEEDGPDEFPVGRPWGYAVFIEPSVVSNGTIYDEYMSRRDAAFWWARHAISCGDILGSRWKTQHLKWPDNLIWPPNSEAQGGDDQSQDGDRLQRAAFQRLREHFISARDQPPKERKVVLSSSGRQNMEPAREDQDMLRDGMLRNVFLVTDQDCVKSIMGPPRGIVDNMWVWAVDPSYGDELEANEASQDRYKYRGFLRVRLQQIVNNFYEACRFHEHDYPLQRLWDISQASRGKAFISIRDEEKGYWLPSRDVGSAIRT